MVYIDPPVKDTSRMWLLTANDIQLEMAETAHTVHDLWILGWSSGSS